MISKKLVGRKISAGEVSNKIGLRTTANEISGSVQQTNTGANNITSSIIDVAKGANDMAKIAAEAANGVNEVSPVFKESVKLPVIQIPELSG